MVSAINESAIERGKDCKSGEQEISCMQSRVIARQLNGQHDHL